MMHFEAPFPPARLDPPLPPPRDRVPTLPFDLAEYAQWSCLPDEEDDLVFTAGPALHEIADHVPHIVADAAGREQLSTCEAMVLSLVDGVSPVSLLVQVTGTDAHEAFVVMCDLYARGLVGFD